MDSTKTHDNHCFCCRISDKKKGPPKSAVMIPKGSSAGMNSDVGAVLDSSKLEAVISDDARCAAVEDGHRPIDHVLGDGEDFELLLAVEQPVTDSPVALYRIGEVTERGLEIRTADGRVERLEPKGYVHS